MDNWLSILPPLVTILLAFITRQVILSLLSGLVIGVTIIHGTDITAYSSFFDTYIINSIANRDHVYIILFSLFISGSVHLSHKNGGMEALLSPLAKWVKTKQQAQGATFISGLLLFFDDYANTLVVGNSFRPITDQFKISREKLAYIVDSTSAPVAAIALVTTWVGAEIGYISEALPTDNTLSPYNLFLNSIPYAFYPLLTLSFIALITFTKSDFGPMHKAELIASNNETTARKTSSTQPKQHFLFGALPIFILILITMTTLYLTGKKSETQSISEIIGNANCYTALLWGSFSSLTVALLLSLIYTSKKINLLIEEIFDGFNLLIPTLAILILSWALGGIIDDLHTADYIIQFLPNTSSWWLPSLIFIISAIVSFSTGSSWGTMAIVFPLAIPLALSNNPSLVLLPSIASVLSGAVFGDHCSPISDTTILSSMATQCDHVTHVKTQLPYAITVAITSLITLMLSSLFGLPFLFLLIGITLLIIVVKLLGKKLPSDQ